MEKNVNVRANSRQNSKGYSVIVRYTRHGSQHKVGTGVFVHDNQKFNDSVKKRNRLIISQFSNEKDYNFVNETLTKVNNIIGDFKYNHRDYPSVDQVKRLLNPSYKDDSDDLISSLKKFQEYQKLRRSSRYCYAVAGIVNALEILSSTKWKNRYYKISDLGKDLFKDLLEYMLFHKVQNRRMTQTKPNHNLGSPDYCIFDKRFGVNNNTLCKRLNDIRSFMKWLLSHEKLTKQTHTNLMEELASTVTALKITKFDNAKVALGTNQMNLLSSDSFEEKITDDYYIVTENGVEIKKTVKKKSLIKAKDFFLFLAFTGVRISDFRKLDKKNLNFNQQVAKKTQSGYMLYKGNPKAFKILEEYNYSFNLSDQKLNQYLKPLMKQFFEFYKENHDNNFAMTLEQVEWRGKYRQIQNLNKFELVGSHTGRRSFATYMYNDGKGATLAQIIKYTGHKSIKQLIQYLQITDEEEDIKSPLSNNY